MRPLEISLWQSLFRRNKMKRFIYHIEHTYGDDQNVWTTAEDESAKEVKSLHGKTVGYSDHACKECAKYKDEALFIIGIDAEKSEKEPWRTGDITGINKDCPLALHIKPNTRTLKDGTTYCFMDKALGIELGLWK